MCAVLTGGLLLLVARWLPIWSLKCRCRRSMLTAATHLLVLRRSGGVDVESFVNNPGANNGVPTNWRKNGYDCLADADPVEDSEPMQFHHRHVRYVWCAENEQFERVCGLDVATPTSKLLAYAHNQEQQSSTRPSLIYRHGANTVDVEVKSYMTLLFEEILSPFYIFQIFAIILWGFELYYYYAGCIVLITIVSVTLSLLETRRNAEALRDMVAYEGVVTRIKTPEGRHGIEVSSSELLPGDLFEVHEGDLVPCDAVIFEGGCVVNESMLTGESVPVTKTALLLEQDDPVFNIEKQKAHTLFYGTQVVQLRSHRLVAICIRTAFDTSKGQLIRSILYPKPTKFRFYQDGMRFLMVLSFFGAAGFIYSAVVLTSRDAPIVKIVKRGFDILTIIVPPALPAAMTVGTMYAITRLKKQKIFCISPPRVNVSGKIKLFCFDKTGTLTEDGLSLHALQETHQGALRESSLEPSPGSSNIINMEYALACCHSLAISRLQNGDVAPIAPAVPSEQSLIGDPLEIQLFLASQWVLVEAQTPAIRLNATGNRLQDLFAQQLGPSSFVYREHDQGASALLMLKEYAFSSHKQRMTVLVASYDVNLHDHEAWTGVPTPRIVAYVKGAPERIAKLCNPKTLPSDFEDVLAAYTHRGLRVLAVAGAFLSTTDLAEAKAMPREKVERDLTFLGFAIFENRVKPETAGILERLHQAHIRTVMITGDNVLTACSVARSSGMVPANAPIFYACVNGPTAFLREDEEEPEDLDSGLVDDAPGVVFKDEEDATTVAQDAHNIQVDVSHLLPWGVRFVEFPHLARDRPVSAWYSPPTGYAAIAVTGREFGTIRREHPQFYQRLLVSATIFARMAPDQKAQLIEDLIALDYCVGMCGDGANDCGALKAAHVGVSLSEAEASVAAPFTSNTPNISCVDTLMREGRAALVTSFSCFKFMALYSFVEFSNVLILYWIDSNLGDMQYLYVDLVLTLTLAVCMGHTAAGPRLAPKRPAGSLVSPAVLVSIVTQILLNVGAQVAILEMARAQSWFQPLHALPDSNNIKCYENTVTFLFANFIYVAVAVAFTSGLPHQAPVLHNYSFIAAVVGLTAVNVLFIAWPTLFIRTTLQTYIIPDWNFRIVMLGMAAAYAFISVVIDRVSTNSTTFRRLIKAVFYKTKYKNAYKQVARDVISDDWLQISSKSKSSSV
ncbi:uncharacterized protein MONBRDRAFT_25515 [Monosiga brevicollis MX1]|uniref:Cation-transporting ATPase n=1 Tax=Monosiga brevicollis TaxID=81824 RepID=A9UZM7_MONBE|nr:uncharacterized protein MONBRDRAFT_25515 [Monosiga brevicollis MX1]EDQ89259.1 predicted protein [Monosiga brevicollis MX1]|eukprot:XP_001745835.1 hypothetical protein [Monosiga brevicollis MX1]